MDSYTTINEKWWLCTFASFLVILVFFLAHSHDNTSTSVLQNLAIPLTKSSPYQFPVADLKISKPENFTDVLQPRNSSAQFPFAISNMQISKPVAEQEIPMSMEEKECDIFDGKWVYDPKASPLYNAGKCPFLSDQVSCQKNGRPDIEYQKWRWEAKGCKVPRFDGKEMLKRLQGKRVIIVGDSLNRNQWESLACLLYSSIHPTQAYVDVKRSDYKVFSARGYNCSVEFYWSPFLVQLVAKKSNGSRVLRLDTMSASARNWHGADVMVFNTGHWWVHRGKVKAWDVFEYDGKVVEKSEVESTFEMAMKTWARWVDENVEPSKTSVFFRSISPEHKGKHDCNNHTEPIMDDSYTTTFPKRMTQVVETTIAAMRTPVKYLNITKLSQYRKDAHPSMYARKHRTTSQQLIAGQRVKEKEQKFFSDCSHWCLPGVPDTWNRLLYASIVLDSFAYNSTSSHLVV